MVEESFSLQATRAAYGWGRTRDWTAALSLLAHAADSGEPGAAEQYALVTQAPIEELVLPPPREGLSQSPRIAALRGFAPPGFAAWLVERAHNRLVAAPLNDAGGKGVRTATAAAFGPAERDVVLAIMQIRAARLTGAPIALHEPPNVISYEPGQEFGPHVDFIEPSVAAFQPELERLGQRSATVVTYLNDDFDGAETVFPDAGIEFRGAPGDAIVWANLLPDGTPDYGTGHFARAPTKGRKWVLSQWIRTRPYPFDAPDEL